MTGLAPLLRFKIVPLNGREARKSGPRLKAQGQVATTELT
jgi:hypothetical protein